MPSSKTHTSLPFSQRASQPLQEAFRAQRQQLAVKIQEGGYSQQQAQQLHHQLQQRQAVRFSQISYMQHGCLGVHVGVEVVFRSGNQAKMSWLSIFPTSFSSAWRYVFQPQHTM